MFICLSHYHSGEAPQVNNLSSAINIYHPQASQGLRVVPFWAARSARIDTIPIKDLILALELVYISALFDFHVLDFVHKQGFTLGTKLDSP